MDYLIKWSNGQMWFANVPLDAYQMNELRKATLDAIDDGEGETDDFVVLDDGEEGYYFEMSNQEVKDKTGYDYIVTWMTPQGVMDYLLATRKMHLATEHEVRNKSKHAERHAVENQQGDVVFSLPDPMNHGQAESPSPTELSAS